MNAGGTFLPKINYLTYHNAASFQQDKSVQLKVTPLTGLLVFPAAKAQTLQSNCKKLLGLPNILTMFEETVSQNTIVIIIISLQNVYNKQLVAHRNKGRSAMALAYITRNQIFVTSFLWHSNSYIIIMMLCDSHNIMKSATKLWIRIKRTDRSH